MLVAVPHSKSGIDHRSFTDYEIGGIMRSLSPGSLLPARRAGNGFVELPRETSEADSSQRLFTRIPASERGRVEDEE